MDTSDTFSPEDVCTWEGSASEGPIWEGSASEGPIWEGFASEGPMEGSVAEGTIWEGSASDGPAREGRSLEGMEESDTVLPLEGVAAEGRNSEGAQVGSLTKGELVVDGTISEGGTDGCSLGTGTSSGRRVVVVFGPAKLLRVSSERVDGAERVI